MSLCPEESLAPCRHVVLTRILQRGDGKPDQPRTPAGAYVEQETGQERRSQSSACIRKHAALRIRFSSLHAASCWGRGSSMVKKEMPHGHLRAGSSYRDPQHRPGGPEHVCRFRLHFKSLTNEATRSGEAFYRARVRKPSLSTDVSFLLWDQHACFVRTVINFSLREDRGKTVIRVLILGCRFLHGATLSGKEGGKTIGP